MTIISLPGKTDIINAIVEPNPPLPRPRFAPAAPGGAEVTIKYWFYASSPQYAVSSFDAFMAAYYPSIGTLAADSPVRPGYEAQYAKVKSVNDTFQRIESAGDQLAVVNNALKPWEKYGNLKFVAATSPADADIRILARTLWSSACLRSLRSAIRRSPLRDSSRC